MDSILKDVESNLKIKINDSDIEVFSDGATNATVFSVKNKYLIKCTTKTELDVYNVFLTNYKSEYFQKMYYINYKLGYICLSYTEGNKYDDNLDIDYVIGTLYDITSNYKVIDYDGFGYLFQDHKTWNEFLKDEINYSKDMIKDFHLNTNILDKAINNVSKYPVKKYLLHGDFGTHNFIINNKKLYVIDPMGLVGDPLYDFYFSIFSNVSIFTKIDFDKILKYFYRDIKYKKTIMIITFFIRLCRAYKYDKNNYDVYLKYYNKLIEVDI